MKNEKLKLFIYYLIYNKLTSSDIEEAVEDVLNYDSKRDLNKFVLQYIDEIFSRLEGSED